MWQMLVIILLDLGAEASGGFKMLSLNYILGFISGVAFTYMFQAIRNRGSQE